MEDILKRLYELRIREGKLSFIKEMNFNSDEEFSDYHKQNEHLFIEINKIRSEIKKIEWNLKTTNEKREDRLYSVDLVKKFKDEIVNKTKGKYKELYIELLDKLKQIIENERDANNKDKLFEIYYFLDEKDFQYQIPEDYLNELSRSPKLSDIIAQLQILLTKL